MGVATGGVTSPGGAGLVRTTVAGLSVQPPSETFHSSSSSSSSSYNHHYHKTFDSAPMFSTNGKRAALMQGRV